MIPAKAMLYILHVIYTSSLIYRVMRVVGLAMHCTYVYFMYMTEVVSAGDDQVCLPVLYVGILCSTVTHP